MSYRKYRYNTYVILMIVLYNFIRNITIAGQIWIKKQVCTKRRGVALNYSSGKKKKERK